MNETDETAALDGVKAKIAAAASGAGRDLADITLIAVSKTHPAARIAPLIAAGQRAFGENRVQEAQGKFPALRDAHPGIELHLIGPLQTNKARDAVALFGAIHSLDRPKLARAIAEAAQKEGRCPRLFVQVNTGSEAQKAGVSPDTAEAFVAQCRDVYGLTIEGLMCIPPFGDDPAPHFEALAALAARCGVPGLSMGMSADYETAIAHGATHVRVGSALFGARQ